MRLNNISLIVFTIEAMDFDEKRGARNYSPQLSPEVMNAVLKWLGDFVDVNALSDHERDQSTSPYETKLQLRYFCTFEKMLAEYTSYCEENKRERVSLTSFCGIWTDFRNNIIRLSPRSDLWTNRGRFSKLILESLKKGNETKHFLKRFPYLVKTQITPVNIAKDARWKRSKLGRRDK